ncbi:fumarylacetoacetate hydrolase family protein [Paracoccus sp. TOH]|uniref:Fumarylacetoacetate hydrolase family protein n=1 Tax=Paracoccus simplex TaxID=2086346 RepID=A0ABV7RVZ1_9RHOB|nr:fumarylacetoacetate hydrolase family protein [Paracoccus sp. TOH]WJS86567.1 fumarylacetoacetate hydrolase family protein [Paracoccus sp. TOH]
MSYVLPVPATPSVPVTGRGERFAVRRIFCVGRNYADHAREMGHDPDREPPFFFSKPADALLTDDAPLPYPPLTADLHYEAELVVAIGRGGSDIPVERAPDHVWGYAAGNDFTRRDLQAEAKRLGRPWDMAKGFDHSAACGAITPAAELGRLDHGRIVSTVDGVLRQQGDLSQMIWSVPEIVAILSRHVALAAGDLIFTGTPAGVGALSRGAQVVVEIDGLAPQRTRVI